MTTAAERIRDAAERDEARAETEPDERPDTPPGETPEQEPEPVPETEPPEPEPAPETPQAGTGLNAEQAGELEKATSAYYRKVAKVFGGELPPECPHCAGLGFDLSGGAETPEYRHASDKDTCDECGGWGAVLSGAKAPGQDVVRCERCKGAGYLVTRPVNIENPNQVAPVVVALAEGNADGGAAVALKPGDPGWEPWMGGGEVAP